MDKAEIAKLSLERVGGKVGRLMSTSTKVNKFLNKNHTIPTSIREIEKWKDAQILGVSGQDEIVSLVNAAIGRTVKSEVDKVAAELAAIQLTKEQLKALPGAIESYEKHLIEYVSKLKRVKEILPKIEVKTPISKPDVKKANVEVKKEKLERVAA